MPSKNRPSTTARGYGATHVRQRKRLLYQLVDGTPCEVCGRPLYKDAAKNFDSAPLEADHGPGSALKFKHGAEKRTTLATRLLHRYCNRSGGAWESKQEEQSSENRQSGLADSVAVRPWSGWSAGS